MKKISLALLMILAIACSARGQDYKKLKFGFAFGLTKGPSPIVSLEPAYRLSDALALGIRLEGTSDFSSETSKSSIILTGQYYFGASKVRPFVGAGLGQYSFKGINNFPARFGFCPRVGIELGHLSLSLDYNLVESTTVDQGFYDIYGVYHLDSHTYTHSYFGIKIGGFLGGGKKR